MDEDLRGDEPSHSWMRGYRRSPEVTTELAAALMKALVEHPEQRLGQLLINVSNVAGGEDLWNVWDEEWVQRLT